MTDHDFTGMITYGPGFEHWITTDPFCALDYSDTGDPTDVALAARVLASYWHGGQASALYAFSSSGHLDADACIYELRQHERAFGRYGTVGALISFFESVKPEDTSEDPCTDHGLDTCPDCGNAGTAIGPDGYYECTRFLTCWTDTPDTPDHEEN